MELIAIIISNLIWVLYSLTEGVKDGIFSHYKKSSKRSCPLNSNRLFNIQRILVLLSTGGVLFWTIGPISIPFIVGQYLMFKYFRKISYDITVKKTQINSENKIEQKLEKNPVLLGIFIQIFSLFLI